MKKWLLHIMFVSVLGMLAASCSQDADDPTQTADSRTAQVVFTIALDSPSAGSRATTTWGEDYLPSEIGTEFDNRINPDQFFVKLTLDDTTYDVQNIAYWPTSEQNVYEFVGEVDVQHINTATIYQGAKIQVYANMNPMNPADDSFTTNYVTNPGTGVAYIPMWGVQTINLSLTPGTRTKLEEPIYLLRAMAKVEVIMAAEDCEIEAIQLNGHNKTGYCLPEGATNAANTKNLNLEDVFRPMPDYIETNNSFMESTNADGNQCYSIYVPEYSNQQTEIPATITVKVGGDDYNIDFKMYENGTATSIAYNIVRNHIYRFCITSVKTEVETTFTYTLDVESYSLINNNIEFY